MNRLAIVGAAGLLAAFGDQVNWDDSRRLTRAESLESLGVTEERMAQEAARNEKAQAKRLRRQLRNQSAQKPRA